MYIYNIYIYMKNGEKWPPNAYRISFAWQWLFFNSSLQLIFTGQVAKHQLLDHMESRMDPIIWRNEVDRIATGGAFVAGTFLTKWENHRNISEKYGTSK